MAETGLVQIVEGALLAAGKALTVAQLGELFEEHERPENAQIREALQEVAERCEDRGFELVEVASGFRFQVRQGLSTWVARLWHERPARYSRALLETLALIAYRQPITRGEIEEIRGVAVSSNIIKTLHEREWIRVVGHRDVPGRPAMYATTRQFLDYFNLKNLDQLPALAEIRDLDTLNAELGFTDPVKEKDDEAGGTPGEGSPELTVVGGIDHNPGADPVSTVASGADTDTDTDTDTDQDSETPTEEEPESAGDLAEAMEGLQVTGETATGDAQEVVEGAADTEQSDDIEAVKPESQA